MKKFQSALSPAGAPHSLWDDSLSQTCYPWPLRPSPTPPTSISHSLGQAASTPGMPAPVLQAEGFPPWRAFFKA